MLKQLPLRCVALLEILAGMFAMAVLAIRLVSASGQFTLDLESGAFLLLGSLALFGGIGLLRAKPVGWHSSVLFQCLMIPVFSLGSAIYRPGVGLFIPLGFQLGSEKTASSILEFTLGVDFTVAMYASQTPQYVAFNVVALAGLAVLLLKRPGRLR